MKANKLAFDNNYEFMINTFEQNNFFLYTLLHQAGNIPEEVRVAIDTWLQGYSRGLEELKTSTDEKYLMVEKCLSSENNLFEHLQTGPEL